MKPIGGYFELEIPKGALPYPKAVPVNFGRGGLELIVRTRGYKKVWIPDYICPVVQLYLEKIGVAFAVYDINANLEPSSLPNLGENEAFLYVDYFGVKDAFCRKLEQTQKDLILDLTQAFYYEPTRADGFNSVRKFFGVPDGGFVFGVGLSNLNLPESHSCDGCEFLLHRADGDVAGGYEAFRRADDGMVDWLAAKMSPLTSALIASCDLSSAAKRRFANFNQLHNMLNRSNQLKLDIAAVHAPLIYPYLMPKGAALKRLLIADKIFCPTYWPDIACMGSAARNFVENLVCIPIDQRYSTVEMAYIANRIAEIVL